MCIYIYICVCANVFFYKLCIYIYVYTYIYIYTEGAVHGDVNFMKKSGQNTVNFNVLWLQRV